jgi:hypothetical protein
MTNNCVYTLGGTRTIPLSSMVCGTRTIPVYSGGNFNTPEQCFVRHKPLKWMVRCCITERF